MHDSIKCWADSDGTVHILTAMAPSKKLKALVSVQIDAVIVNCTSFSPVPSLAAAVINHFKMKPTVLAYSLSGMGCAASVIAIDLARELLQVWFVPLRLVVIVSCSMHAPVPFDSIFAILIWLLDV